MYFLHTTATYKFDFYILTAPSALYSDASVFYWRVWHYLKVWHWLTTYMNNCMILSCKFQSFLIQWHITDHMGDQLTHIELPTGATILQSSFHLHHNPCNTRVLINNAKQHTGLATHSGWIFELLVHQVVMDTPKQFTAHFLAINSWCALFEDKVGGRYAHLSVQLRPLTFECC